MKMNFVTTVNSPRKSVSKTFYKTVGKAAEEEQQQVVIESEPLARDKMIYHQPLRADIHHFYLYDSITEPTEYLPLVKALGDASPSDQFVIHINCWGGDVFSAIEIINAIAMSEAPVIASIEGACASAATMVALACEGWSLSEMSAFMVHAPTLGRYGKFNEMNASHDFDILWTKKLFNKVYKFFLTDEEIDQVLEGKDLWFESDETLRRLQLLTKAREAMAEEEKEDGCEEEHCECKKKKLQESDHKEEEKVKEEKPKRKSRVKPTFESSLDFPVDFEPSRTLLDKLNKR